MRMTTPSVTPISHVGRKRRVAYATTTQDPSRGRRSAAYPPSETPPSWESWPIVAKTTIATAPASASYAKVSDAGTVSDTREAPNAAEVTRAHGDDPDLAARVRRFDHLAVPDVHRDVADDRMLVEQEIARQHRVERHGLACGELCVGIARDRDPVCAVGRPGETGAVVAPPRQSAPEVVQAHELRRGADDVCARDRQLPRRTRGER